MRVAVLGAYGAVGRRLVVQARALGYAVTAAGRNPDKLAQVGAHHRLHLDVGDPDALLALAREHDVLINATGVEDPGVAVTATAGGAAFMDISAESRYLEQLGRLEHPRQPIAAGTGLAPGLTNVLAATVPGHGPLHIGIIGGVGERHGNAARRWIWEAAGCAVTSGGTTERVYRKIRRFDVPGLGRRSLMRAAGLLDSLSGPFAERLSSYDRWAIVVTDGTTAAAWASGRREVDATAMVAALCIRPLREAAAGIYGAHRLVALEDLESGLALSGITVGGRRPSSLPSGACITPSRVTNPETISFLIRASCQG